MSSYNNQEERQSFWHRAFLGIPLWLLTLALIGLLLWWLLRQPDLFSPVTTGKNLTFAQRGLLGQPTVSSVEPIPTVSRI